MIGIIVIVITNFLTFYLTANGNLSLGNKVVLDVNSQEMADGLRKLVTLKAHIDKEYYKDVDDTVLIEGAMKGMFEATGDKYSGYYPKEEFKKLMETSTGTYSGIGVVVTEDDNGTTTVVTPYKKTPAGEAGVQIGDKIIKVNDEDVSTKGVDYTVNLMRGEPGTPVNVTVFRESGEQTFNLTRQQINTPTVDSKVSGSTGIIAITEFTEKTSDDFNEQLDALLAQNITGLIIDLRYNGGGLVTSSVAIADRLLGETTVVYTVDKNGKRKDYNSTEDVKLELPIAMLVNEGTASASEILSGAIQDTKAGTLIGNQTFGKGIVQEVVPLKDDSGYKLTNAEYFTPAGRNINEKGLTPDVGVDQSEEYKKILNVPEERDLQLQKAFEVLQMPQQ
ncbi:MAG: S41 family peptidase [Eubacterium sp.]